MNQQFLVLLYSNFSPNSSKLRTLISRCGVDFYGATGLQELCIDNPEVRKRVMTSSHIEVSSVPTILVIYSDGGVEKYEGSTAFRWVEEIITKLAPPPPPAPVEPIAPPPQEHRRAPKQAPKQAPKRRERRPRTPSPPPEQGTMIEELDSEGEESDEDYIPKRPPVGMRTDAGNYELEESFEQTDPEPSRGVTRGIRENTGQTKKGDDILAAAQAMQKDRESDLEKRRPKGMPANTN